MEMWFMIIVSLCISSILKSLFALLFRGSSSTQPQPQPLPPGPPTLPLIGNLLWFRKPFFQLGPIIRSHGPLVTLKIGSRPAIFVGSHSLAHQALIQNGAVFASRPHPSTLPQNQLLSGSGRPDIGTSAYASTWRLLRRNITSKILSPSSIKSYSHVRRRVLRILLNALKQHSNNPVVVVDHFQYAMFSILVLMCFGDDVLDPQIKLVETVQRRLILNFPRLQLLTFAPWLRNIHVFRKRWNHHLQLLRDQADVFIPLISSRRHAKLKKPPEKHLPLSYVDTLLDLQLPGSVEGENINNYKKLDDDGMVGLCTEFMVGGTDTTTTALQWIMANLVKHPHIQAKLFAEINGSSTVKSKELEEIQEEDLHKFPYLKAVILEGLRRHPPLHSVIPHAVTEDIILDGYVIPKPAPVNFLVAEMGRDPNVWEDPLEFKPERFMSSTDGNRGIEFDITGNKEIKMMPFSAGRRICPGYSLAMLHLEYFVANLVWNFEWKAVDGEGVDLSEKEEMTVEMKNPLRVHLSPRLK